jgi:hypothetical protein
MPVILVNKVVDPKRTIGKSGGPRRHKGSLTPQKLFSLRKLPSPFTLHVKGDAGHHG